MKPIVIYYSRSGNTEKLAQRVATDLQCGTIRIEPEEAYGNYVAALTRAMKERSQKVPPAFITPIPDLGDYDTVLLGYPIWMQAPPELVSEFIARCDLQGKTVVPFVTGGLANVSVTLGTLEKACRGAKIILPFHWGLLKKDDYDHWIRSIP